MSKLKLSIGEWRASEGTRCPVCGVMCAASTGDGLTFAVATIVTRQVECEECGAIWEEEYELCRFGKVFDLKGNQLVQSVTNPIEQLYKAASELTDQLTGLSIHEWVQKEYDELLAALTAYDGRKR